MKNELTTIETAEYAKLDETISKGADTFMEVGAALVKMKESKLYLRDFETFEAYANSRGISRSYAYKLMGAVQTALELEKVSKRDTGSDSVNTGDGSKSSEPLHLSIINELNKYPAPRRMEILDLVRKDGKPTVLRVQAAAATVLHLTPPERKKRAKREAVVEIHAQVIESQNTENDAILSERTVKAAAELNASSPASAISPPDAILTEKDQIHVNAQAMQDMATEYGIIKDILEGLSEALGCPSDDYEALVAAIDTLKEKTPDSALEDVAAALGCQPQQQVIIKCITELKSQTNALVIKMNDFGPEPKTVPLTPKLYERKLAALDLGAEEAAKGDEQERKKYGVIANRSANAFMNPKKKLEYNPYS